MATLYTEADKNTRLTWIYIAGFLAFVIGVGYVFAGAMGNSTILYIAVAFSIVMSFGSYWWSDKIVLAMSGAKEVTHEGNRELYHLVENLCITAGLPAPKIYIIEDSAPNAFATGRDPQHGVICVTTGLLDKLEKIELEGVIAHELSHIGNRDILLSTVVVVLVGFVALIADWFRHWSFFGGGDDSDNRNPILMIVGILLSLLAPLAAIMMRPRTPRSRQPRHRTSLHLKSLQGQQGFQTFFHPPTN
ncbi:MAG: Protease HtpX-like protein [Candidatus Moranbacteria bacterium GW2011_GWD1_36_198]|nr:MAG: Protease HtpX-like protein [Candidatus Moranbacteria bacterium GW2011_GWD1_36_198]